VSNPK